MPTLPTIVRAPIVALAASFLLFEAGCGGSSTAQPADTTGGTGGSSGKGGAGGHAGSTTGKGVVGGHGGAAGAAGTTGAAGGTGAGMGCGLVTCASAGANCGKIGDGCNGTLDCGTCTAPDTCGGGTAPNVCGSNGMSSCTPKTCADLGFNCGMQGDGCGKVLDCGTCTAPAPIGWAAIQSERRHHDVQQRRRQPNRHMLRHLAEEPLHRVRLPSWYIEVDLVHRYDGEQTEIRTATVDSSSKQ